MQPQPLSILIADDHEVIRRALRSLLLSRPDWTVCAEAVDGSEAVQMTRTHKPDVVLMDISMPEMNGMEAARIIRHEFPQTSVLIISQNDPEITRRQSKDVGAAAYVAKADLSRNLLGAIEKIVDQRNGCSGTASSKPSIPSELVKSTVPWLAGGGEMGALMRTRDWSDTLLGPPEDWPESLQLSTSICVSSRFDLIVWWGPDLIMLYNDSYRRTLGAKHPFALGRPGRDVYPEIWDVIGPMLQHVMRTGEATWSADLMLLLERSGYSEETYHTFSYTPIRNQLGKVVGVITPVTETTDKVISERRLLTLRDLAARSLDATNEAESWEFAGRALSNNPYDIACAVLYKFDEDVANAHLVACQGLRDGESFFPKEVELKRETPGLLESALHSAVQTGKPIELNEKDDLRVSLPGGIWRQSPKELIVLPIQTGPGNAIGALVVGVNPHKRLDDDYRGFLSLVSGQTAKSIVDARLLDQERQRAEALAKLDHAKTTFFSNISHELRTPLTLILAPIEELLLRGDPVSVSARELRLVQRNALRLLKLVNTLLDFSRIEAGRTQATYEPVALGRVTADIASIFRSAIEKAGLRFEVEWAELDEALHIDVQMWEKIVLNLISNALKFTSSGTITVALKRKENMAQLTVADTGAGIPTSELPRIFERFYRVEGTSGRTYEGSGIGLALVQELVKLHGGSITVESKLGAGTRFTVSVPFGSAHLPKERLGATTDASTRAQQRAMFENEALGWLPGETDRDANPSAPAKLQAKPIFGRVPCVLLVEDNGDMRDYVRRMLLEAGYEVDTAADGQAALPLITKKGYDLVLSDVMMPKVDGIELLETIRQDPNLKTTPVVLLSARAGEEFRIQGLRAGADDYLAKPFTPRDLLSRVASQIESHIRRHESEERLNLALELGRMGTWDMDVDTQAMVWSPSEYELLGYEPQECTPSWEAWKSRIHPQDLELLLSSWEKAKRNREDLRMEYRVVLPSGEIRWIEDKARFFYDSAGRAQRIIGASRNITSRKQTEERLRSGRDRLLEAVKGQQVALQQTAAEAATQAELLDLANDAAFISNLENRISYWNRGAERLYGWTREEAVGRNASELLQTEFPVSYQEVVATLRSKGVWEGELQQSTRYGNRMTVASRWTYRRDAQGNPVGWLEINSDLTLQKQAQEAARRLSARILQVQDLERRKLARDLHDSLGQYLASLKINIRSSLREIRSESARKMLTESIALLEQCLTETRTISYLLHPPLLDETGLGSAIRWYVEGFAQRSGILVSLNIPERIPRFTNEIETAFFRILQESLTNAHRHAKTERVDVTMEVGQHTIALNVRDYGCGIAPERLRSFLEKNEGMGVGLGGMRERARELGGSLSVAAAVPPPGFLVSVEIPTMGPTNQESEMISSEANES